jgi:hypothetical protein
MGGSETGARIESSTSSSEGATGILLSSGSCIVIYSDCVCWQACFTPCIPTTYDSARIFPSCIDQLVRRPGAGLFGTSGAVEREVRILGNSHSANLRYDIVRIHANCAFCNFMIIVKTRSSAHVENANVCAIGT